MKGERVAERGVVTAFVASITVALLAVAGLVIDGGLVLASRQAAFDEAGAAARAGAQAVDIDILRSRSVVVLDAAAARRRALDRLDATGHAGTATVRGNRIRVTVTVRRRLTLLGLVGLRTVTVRATGTARAAHGVRADGR